MSKLENRRRRSSFFVSSYSEVAGDKTGLPSDETSIKELIEQYKTERKDWNNLYTTLKIKLQKLDKQRKLDETIELSNNFLKLLPEDYHQFFEKLEECKQQYFTLKSKVNTVKNISAVIVANHEIIKANTEGCFHKLLSNSSRIEGLLSSLECSDQKPEMLYEIENCGFYGDSFLSVHT